jgi:hypothetical protein
MISFNPIYCHTDIATQEQLLRQHYKAQYKNTHDDDNENNNKNKKDN